MTPMTKDRYPLLIDLEGIWRLMVKHQCADAPKAALVAKEVRDIYEAERKRLNDGWWNDRAKLLELVRQAQALMLTHCSHTHACELGMALGVDAEMQVQYAGCNCGLDAFLSRCKEVVPDLLVDEGAPPSGSGSPLQSAEDGRISASILSANGWIPVGERFPENGQRVDVWIVSSYGEQKNIFPCRGPDVKWDGAQWIGIFGNPLHGSQRVTHWRPLPPSPTEP